MSKAHRILVVDDEPDLENLVKQRMRREIRRGNYEFVFAQNGVEALERLNEDGRIDMVLTDINMPEMDGLTLLEQIPSVDPNVRSVVVSAYGDMKNIRTAMNRGAFDFVTKPIDFDDFRLTIKRTLEHLVMLREALEARDNLIAIRSDLNLAGKMQQAILPKKFPRSDAFEVFANMEAARDVGGRLLRRDYAARGVCGHHHCRRVGQGRARRHVHDVEPHPAQQRGRGACGFGRWRRRAPGSAPRRCSTRSIACLKKTTRRRCL